MRPYRGLTKDGKWVYGNYCNLAGLSYIAEYPVGAGKNVDGKIISSWIEVIPKTVGQQVGRQDKNEEEIYEGDKVTALCWGGIVEFVNGAFKIVKGGYANSSNFDAVKIIGNIHQNPELVGGAK